MGDRTSEPARHERRYGKVSKRVEANRRGCYAEMRGIITPTTAETSPAGRARNAPVTGATSLPIPIDIPASVQNLGDKRPPNQ
jgi:hypothetical protein